jgi:hypothetical protein
MTGQCLAQPTLLGSARSRGTALSSTAPTQGLHDLAPSKPIVVHRDLPELILDAILPDLVALRRGDLEI